MLCYTIFFFYKLVCENIAILLCVVRCRVERADAGVAHLLGRRPELPLGLQSSELCRCVDDLGMRHSTVIGT